MASVRGCSYGGGVVGQWGGNFPLLPTNCILDMTICGNMNFLSVFFFALIASVRAVFHSSDCCGLITMLTENLLLV